MDKPLVFLSHSKKDIEFILKLESDLRRCKIETWLDEIDIQHGESWLKAIFEQGIEKCDFVLVYMSSNSLNSQMVQKEIDSTIINQLYEKNIKLIPYVDSELTRTSLRLDLQSLQMPILNVENYEKILPVIIANIWSIFLNKLISKIVKEKDLEIENLKLKHEINNTKNNIMQTFENEFNLFLEEFNRPITITCNFTNKNAKDEIIKRIFNINMITAFYIIYFNISGKINESYIQHSIIRFIDKKVNPITPLDTFECESDFGESFMDKLMIYGFVVRNFNPEPQATDKMHMKYLYNLHTYEIYLKSEKFDRFILWLKIKNIKLDETVFELEN